MSTLTYIPDPALPDLLQGVQQRASALNRNVVLCEADDPRVLRAGVQAAIALTTSTVSVSMSLSSATTNHLSSLRDIEKSPIRKLRIRGIFR